MTQKKKPERRCVGCGRSFEKEGLLRIVRDAEGRFLFDKSGKADGRGAYLCRHADCLLKAEKNRGLDRSFRMKVPEEAYRALGEALDTTDD